MLQEGPQVHPVDRPAVLQRIAADHQLVSFTDPHHDLPFPDGGLAPHALLIVLHIMSAAITQCITVMYRIYNCYNQQYNNK